MTRWLMMSLLAASAGAQTLGSVSGVARDSLTGTPLAEVTVSTYINAQFTSSGVMMSATSKQVQTVTDEQGRYKLGDLPAGRYRLQAMPKWRSHQFPARNVALAEGQALESIDFWLAAPAVIRGRVIDQNKEPISGATVFLVSEEYFMGAAGQFIKSLTRTDDQGEYRLERVEPGRPYRVLVENRPQTLESVSDAPREPKLRKPAWAPTAYPNSRGLAGGIVLTLRAGETREDVDVQVQRTPSYCIEGVAGAARPVALSFWLTPQEGTAGLSNNMGLFLRPPMGEVGEGGRLRICNLAPGAYQLTVFESKPASASVPPLFGSVMMNITDSDVRDVRVTAAPGLPLQGETAWLGEAPAKPPPVQVRVLLSPMTRASFRGENNSLRADIPGTFTLPAMLMDDYAPRVMVNAPGLYVKDAAYGGRSVLNEPLRLGSAIAGAVLRITVGHDGGTLRVSVTDKDGKPVPDAKVVLAPADAASEAAFAALLTTGATDQEGAYTSDTLAPGKYLAFALETPVDYSVAGIQKLWRARDRAKEVELAPRGSAQITLKLGAVE